MQPQGSLLRVSLNLGYVSMPPSQPRQARTGHVNEPPPTYCSARMEMPRYHQARELATHVLHFRLNNHKGNAIVCRGNILPTKRSGF